MSLSPTPDFDWLLVEWRGPKQTAATSCSYCREPLGDDEDDGYEIPLMLWTAFGQLGWRQPNADWNKDGWAARFCINCQRRYWGFTDA
jgi:hypothetical protein